VNLAPRGWLCPLGILFIPSFTPRGEQSLMFRIMKRLTEGLHPWGITSLLGDIFYPCILCNFTPGVNFAPRFGFTYMPM
jgi:hypothetical protein